MKNTTSPWHGDSSDKTPPGRGMISWQQLDHLTTAGSADHSWISSKGLCPSSLLGDPSSLLAPWRSLLAPQSRNQSFRTRDGELERLPIHGIRELRCTLCTHLSSRFRPPPALCVFLPVWLSAPPYISTCILLPVSPVCSLFRASLSLVPRVPAIYLFIKTLVFWVVHLSPLPCCPVITELWPDGNLFFSCARH